MTPEENERSRYLLYKDGSGKKRIAMLQGVLSYIEKELDNPTNNDAFYGRVDCLLTEMEDFVEKERPYASAVFSDRRISRRDSFSRMEARFSMRARASSSDMR